jgi:hypothetical protein
MSTSVSSGADEDGDVDDANDDDDDDDDDDMFANTDRQTLIGCGRTSTPQSACVLRNSNPAA